MGQCANCFPGPNGTSNCWAVKPFTTYRLKGYNLIDAAPEELEHAIMSEIYRRGPVTCGIYTSEVFDFNYFGGVWTQDNDDFDHDIEVVGWGTEDGEDYWHIRNSWGTYWGEQGFLRIKRGLAKGLVEYDCWFSVPDYSAEHALYPHGDLTGSMQGLLNRDKMIINLQKKEPLVEPEPPVSIQFSAIDGLPILVGSNSFAFWLIVIGVIGVLGIFGIAYKIRGSKASYDPIGDL